MKQSSIPQGRNRTESLEENRIFHIQGILKKPSKYKLKHQRSVRFEEPENSSQFTDNHFGPDSADSTQNSTLNTCPSKSQFSSTSPVKILNKLGKGAKDDFSSTPLKIIKLAKQDNCQDFKGSPKSCLKVLKFDCRDDKFYNKLNFFLNAKGSLSPFRGSSWGSEKEAKWDSKRTSVVRNRLYEDPANLEAKKNGRRKRGKNENGSFIN